MIPNGVYSKAELYDIAFDFRDVAGECDALLDVFRMHTGRRARSFVELAAGPAAHAREMASRRMQSVAVDLSPEMVDLGNRLAESARIELRYIEADIAEFSIDEPVDLAAILMASESVLLDNEAVLSHLDCVADALKPGGIYILEMEHPRDVFGVGRSADRDWVMERDGVTVHTIWGRDGDHFDPITQITDDTVTVAWQRGEERGEVTEVLPARRFAPNEFRALVTASGRFEIVAELGALNPDLPVSNDRKSWRIVPVLRRLL